MQMLPNVNYRHLSFIGQYLSSTKELTITAFHNFNGLNSHIMCAKCRRRISIKKKSRILWSPCLNQID